MDDFDRRVFGNITELLFLLGILILVVGGAFVTLNWLAHTGVGQTIGSWADTVVNHVGNWWSSLDDDTQFFVLAGGVIAFVVSMILLPVICRGWNSKEKYYGTAVTRL